MSYRSLVIVIAVVGVGAIAIRPSFDSDTWWHLRTGAWMLENGRLPVADPFSHTMYGSPWVYPGWLAQLALVGAYRLGGLAGLSVFTAIFAAVGLGLTWRLLDGPVIVRAAVLLLAAATSAIYWAARPHILTFALGALTLWALESNRRHGRRWAIWALPPAMALWVNLHGGFAVGFILILMYVAGELAEVGRRSFGLPGGIRAAWPGRRRRVASLLIVLAACVLASAANPHGPAILAYPFKTVSIPVLQDHILEWQPPDLTQRGLLPFAGLLLAAAASLIAGRRRATALEWVVVGGWAVLALSAVRNVPFFALAAALPVSREAGRLLQSAGLEQPDGPPAGRGRRLVHAVAAAALSGAGLSWAVVQLGPAATGAHLERQVPLAAIEHLRVTAPAGRLFNDYNWGGYILWALYPDYPTFVDGRTDVFSAEVFEAYLRIWSADRGWPEAIDRYRIGVVIVPPEAPAVAALSGAGWRVEFRDAQAAVLSPPDR